MATTTKHGVIYLIWFEFVGQIFHFLFFFFLVNFDVISGVLAPKLHAEKIDSRLSERSCIYWSQSNNDLYLHNQAHLTGTQD